MTAIDATGLVVAPLFDPALREGEIVRLPDWSAKPAARTVSVGEPASLLLLRPEPDGAYRIVRVLSW